MPEKFQFFDGRKFTRDEKTGYYLCSTKDSTGSRKRMHVYVWEYYNGLVPEGYHIHHIDGCKSNNTIENLQLLSATEHEKLHGEMLTDEQIECARKNMMKASVASKEWHGSKEGHEWHKKHYEKMKDKMYVNKQFTCIVCGRQFESPNTQSKFCCNNCKSKYRRREGIDNIEDKCIVCGKTFVKNKYAKKETCSKECATKLRIYRRNKIHWQS